MFAGRNNNGIGGCCHENGEQQQSVSSSCHADPSINPWVGLMVELYGDMVEQMNRFRREFGIDDGGTSRVTKVPERSSFLSTVPNEEYKQTTGCGTRWWNWPKWCSHGSNDRDNVLLPMTGYRCDYRHPHSENSTDTNSTDGSMSSNSRCSSNFNNNSNSSSSGNQNNNSATSSNNILGVHSTKDFTTNEGFYKNECFWPYWGWDTFHNFACDPFFQDPFDFPRLFTTPLSPFFPNFSLFRTRRHIHPNATLPISDDVSRMSAPEVTPLAQQMPVQVQRVPTGTTCGTVRNAESLADFGSRGVCVPRLDMLDEKGRYLIKADLPGMKKENITVDVENGLLTISGSAKDERTDRAKDYMLQERCASKFFRTLQLPENIREDQIKATFDNDATLTVSIPKEDFSAKNQKVFINID